MPVALTGSSNTFMQLRVQDNVLQRRPVVQLSFPASTPAAFGLLQSDSDGSMTWLTQYVNALVPPPNLVYFFTGVCGSNGTAGLQGSSTIELRPFSTKVLYALTLKARSYSSTGVFAVYCQTAVVFDPLQPLSTLWSPLHLEKYGDNADKIDIQMALQRTVSNGVTVSFSASSVPGNTVDVDVIVQNPTGIPVS